MEIFCGFLHMPARPGFFPQLRGSVCSVQPICDRSVDFGLRRPHLTFQKNFGIIYMNKKEKRKIAEKIVKLENQLNLDKDCQSAMEEIQKIVNTLSLEDMLEIDEYITVKKLLTK